MALNYLMAKVQKEERLYAVVDIETTGGHALGNGITEIAILVHNGKKTVKQFHSLVNPQCLIPGFITGLTGITNQMVMDAPVFNEIASTVFDLLQGKVFVAHNVNFDYSFLRHQLLDSGFDLQVQKLCTVRLSRKVFPGLKSYGLGNICGHLGIAIANRHRAKGDAMATVKLLEEILAHDQLGAIDAALKRGSKEYLLPPDLKKQDIDQLPPTPGVYYFHDAKGRVVYIGKAKHLKRRVTSHFSNNSAGKQKQDFLRHIHRISFVETGNELFAHIHELLEIKEKWPEFNRAQKGYTPRYGLFTYFDQRGYQRLIVKTIGKYQQPLYYFKSVTEGLEFLRFQAQDYQLCSRYCGLEGGNEACAGYESGNCLGGCLHEESAEDYNTRVTSMLSQWVDKNYILTKEGRTEDEVGVLLIEQGNFWGYGFVPKAEYMADRNWLKEKIPRAKWFPYIDQLILNQEDDLICV